MHGQGSDDDLPPHIGIPRQEQALIDLVSEIAGPRVLCTSAGRAQLAVAIAQQLDCQQVTCWFLDLYQAHLARAAQHALPPAMEIICQEDFPAALYDSVLLPLSSHGEAELARDLIQAAHQRLSSGGKLLVSTDNPRDRWLGEQLEKLPLSIERRQRDDAAVYIATKTEPLRKIKNYNASFAFRDQGRLFTAYSRPGVFAHRRVDPGARHLLGALDIRPDDRVLELGCGSGVVSLGAAARCATAQVHAVDVCARAVQCTNEGARANRLSNVTAQLITSDELTMVEPQQLVVANPPYYSNFRIARSFLLAAHRVLVKRGQLLVVTKFADWYLEHAPQWFEDVQVDAVKGYFIVRGVRGS